MRSVFRRLVSASNLSFARINNVRYCSKEVDKKEAKDKDDDDEVKKSKVMVMFFYPFYL